MQNSIMFLDTKALGVASKTQQVAIKMPGNADDSTDFSDIVSALMNMAPEQLQDSFDQMEWIAIGDETAGFAPLIDLSRAQGNEGNTLQNIIGHLVSGKASLPHNISEQNQISTVGLANESLEQGKVPNVDVDEKLLARQVDVKTSSQVDVKTSSQVVTASLNTDMDSNNNEKGFTKPVLNDDHIQVLKNSEQKNGEAYSKPDLNKINNDDFFKTDQNKIAGLNGDKAANQKTIEKLQAGKDIPPESLRLVENAEKEIKTSDKLHANASIPSNDDKPKIAVGADNRSAFNNNNERNKESFAKFETKEKSDLKEHVRLSNDTKPSFIREPTEQPSDRSEGVLKNIQDHREVHQTMNSKIVSSNEKSVEFVAANKEAPSPNGDAKIDIIRQMVQRMTLQSQGRQSTMTVQLKPEFLGNVHMQISTEEQQVIVRMATESFAVKEMVEQGLQYLKSELQQHGLEIDKFEVFVSNEESDDGQDLEKFKQAMKERRRDNMSDTDGKNEADNNEGPVDPNTSRRSLDRPGEVDYFV